MCCPLRLILRGWQSVQSSQIRHRLAVSCCSAQRYESSPISETCFGPTYLVAATFDHLLDLYSRDLRRDLSPILLRQPLPPLRRITRSSTRLFNQSYHSLTVEPSQYLQPIITGCLTIRRRAVSIEDEFLVSIRRDPQDPPPSNLGLSLLDAHELQLSSEVRTVPQAFWDVLADRPLSPAFQQRVMDSHEPGGSVRRHRSDRGRVEPAKMLCMGEVE